MLFHNQKLCSIIDWERVIIMASLAMHLAVAKKYIEEHNHLNYEEFIKGTLYPDLDENWIGLHYTKGPITGEFATVVYDKVDLYAFLMDHPELNDFELGHFLHLVTDYLFFLECFDGDYVRNTKYEDFHKELYHSYDSLDSYLISKYNIVKSDYKGYPTQHRSGMPYEEGLISKELIDCFIKRVSSIDLEKYIDKIRKFKDNIIP